MAKKLNKIPFSVRRRSNWIYLWPIGWIFNKVWIFYWCCYNCRYYYSVCDSNKISRKNKRYLNLNQKVKENVELYSIDSEKETLEKLEKYLYKSIQEEERIYTLIQEFEWERERLKEEIFNKTLEQMKDGAWQNYAHL